MDDSKFIGYFIIAASGTIIAVFSPNGWGWLIVRLIALIFAYIYAPKAYNEIKDEIFR